MKFTLLQWLDVEALPKETPAVFPIEACEQHGGQLPLHTADILLEEIVGRTERRLAQRSVCPAIMAWKFAASFGFFPGTITAEPRLYLDLLLNDLECVLSHGFRRLILFNGHGGNIVSSVQAAFDLRRKHRHYSDMSMLSTACWKNAHPKNYRNDLAQPMEHACKWETSRLLAITYPRPAFCKTLLSRRQIAD